MSRWIECSHGWRFDLDATLRAEDVRHLQSHQGDAVRLVVEPRDANITISMVIPAAAQEAARRNGVLPPAPEEP